MPGGDLRPCGTLAAYRRHLRRGEPVDGLCAEASRRDTAERENQGREQTRELLTLAIAAAPPIDESTEIDPLQKARENLRLVEAVMNTGHPTGFAALSKQHVDLVALIARLEKASRPGVSALDDIARRRADRLAASSD